MTGDRLDEYRSGAAYWWQNTRATVLFEPALRSMLDDGYTHFVELGPHPVLAASIAELAADQNVDAVVLASQRRNDDDGRTLMNCVGALHCHGYPLAWDALYPRARLGLSSFRRTRGSTNASGTNPRRRPKTCTTNRCIRCWDNR